MTITDITYSNEYTSFSRQQLVAKVKSQLSQQRFDHVIRVEKTALELAERYHVDPQKVSIAALLHDYAKELKQETMRDKVISENLNLEMLNFGGAICHGPVGAVFAQKEFNIQDQDILNAIRHHTCGSQQMSELEKVIFIADYIEPERQAPTAPVARAYAKESLNKALAYIITQEILYLIDRGIAVYPATIETYNAYAVKNK